MPPPLGALRPRAPTISTPKFPSELRPSRCRAAGPAPKRLFPRSGPVRSGRPSSLLGERTHDSSYAQRARGGHNPLRVGVIPVGAIFYLQNDSWWRDRYRGHAVCRDPWIVDGFLNGPMSASRRNHDTGLWESTYRAARSDMALVRSLRDGRRRSIPVRTLQLHEEFGLAQPPTTYPSLPDLRFYRVPPVVRRWTA